MEAGPNHADADIQDRRDLLAGEAVHGVEQDHFALLSGQTVKALLYLPAELRRRYRDNLIQGLVILITTLLGVGVGALVADETVAGLLVGALVGMLVGLFGSGIFLMIYRAFKH